MEGFKQYLKTPEWRRQHRWRRAIFNTMARLGLTGVHALPINRRWIDIHRRKMPLRGLDPAMVDAAAEGGADVMVTPHAAEFQRVAGVGGGAFSVRAYAGKKGVVTLLKGNPTLISDGSEPILVRTGGPELASIGTGDVLSGMVGALWARGLEPRTAAVSGAYWHGVAAEDLSALGTVTAERLLSAIGRWAW